MPASTVIALRLEVLLTTFNRPKSLTELVTENVRDRIVSGELVLGGQVSEARIAKELDVSRTPVREAINRLEMEGLLKVEPQRGSFIFDLDGGELAKLCDARVALETKALTVASKECPDKLYSELTKCTDRMTSARAVDDVNRYLAEDTIFHQLLFDCADNKFLNDAYQTIATKMAAIRNRLGRHPAHMAKSYAEHLQLVDAVKARDTETALRILRLHIDRKEGSYWSEATQESSE